MLTILKSGVFGSTGAILILTFPLAHYFVRPIQQLRTATLKTVQPYVPDSMGRTSGSSTNFDGPEGGGGEGGEDEESIEDQAAARKEGFMAAVSRWKSGFTRYQASN